MKLRTIAMGMGGILLAASCTNDVVEEVNMGQEISFTTRMTRANAVDNVDALKQFRVFAKAEGYTVRPYWIYTDVHRRRSRKTRHCIRRKENFLDGPRIPLAYGNKQHTVLGICSHRPDKVKRQ